MICVVSARKIVVNERNILLNYDNPRNTDRYFCTWDAIVAIRGGIPRNRKWRGDLPRVRQSGEDVETSRGLDRAWDLWLELRLRKMNAGVEKGTSSREERSMSATHVVVDGTVKADGTLELDSKLNLPPGRVQLIVQPLPELPN
jgi:hypothetical protein